MTARTAHLRLSIHSHHEAPRLAHLVRGLVRRLDQTLIHPYHPEQHYMRGPGPRWHAKHGKDQAAARRDG